MNSKRFYVLKFNQVYLQRVEIGPIFYYGLELKDAIVFESTDKLTAFLLPFYQKLLNREDSKRWVDEFNTMKVWEINITEQLV